MADGADESIYGHDDRIEQTIDTSGDIFDDVFGADEEKKAAKKKLEEKARELEEKLKKKNEKTEEKIVETEDDDDELIDGEEGSTEPELFIDVEMSEEKKDFEKKARKVKALTDDDRLKKKRTDFQEQIDEGLEKSLNGEGKSEKPKEEIKRKETSGKLNLNLIHQEEEEEEEILPSSPIEKNIIKSVIKNKAQKAIEDEHDEMAEDLFKEHGIKEDESVPKFGFKQEAEETIKEELLEEEEEVEGKETGIKPKLDLLLSETGNTYIGRKKSVLKKYGDEAGLFVGRVGEDDLHHKRVYLDGLNPHVVFVCGARGSGKSYVLGVIAEEMALKNKNVGIVVVDPIGVFWSMKYPNREDKELELLAEWDIMPQGLDNIKVFIPVGMKSSVPKSTYDSTFSIQPALLTAEDWCLTFGIDRFSPTGLLMEKGIFKVKKGYTNQEGKFIRGKENTFSLDDLIICFDHDAELNDREKGYKADSVRALVSRFDAAKAWGIFDEKGTPLSLLSKAGQMTILDTSFLEDNVSALVIGILARRLLSARKLSTRREAAGKFVDNNLEDLVELNVPPTWLFIDEAHTLIPGGNQKTPASNALVEYVKQGRRPGLSLVFATQQPSAIDSRVLSQLDVIMAHKLVFDDDVKAIHKRTPAIIPSQYKKPNFIKTLPVGTALTGDRQETTTRAFIMNIRPRMSQHEGRDAETIEVKHELSKDQVEKLGLSIILSQLQKDPSISIESLEQILETLNNTYKQNVSLELLLTLAKAKGVRVDNERLFAPGVKEEMEADEAKEKEETEIIAAGENVENKVEMKMKEPQVETKEKDYKETVELMAIKSNINEADARKLLAGLRLKKKLGLFGEEEILDRLSMKCASIYKIRYNYFSQKDAYQIGEAYVNSLTGEFIHEINGKLVQSKGFNIINNLSEIESKALKFILKPVSLDDAAKHLEMEVGNAKRVLDKLVAKKLAIVEERNGKFAYFIKSKKDFDLPKNPLENILPSIGKMPITEVEAVSVVPPRVSEDDIVKSMKKLWSTISVKEVTHLFLPVWEGVLKKKTGEERIELIDAINGFKINLIETV